MKSVLIALMLQIAFSSYAYANEQILPLDGMIKKTQKEALQIRNALLAANGGTLSYGSCHFGDIAKNDVDLYVDEKNIEPLIIVIFKTSKEWLKINSDMTKRKIISVEGGTFINSFINTGTMINPILKPVLITNEVDMCIQD